MTGRRTRLEIARELASIAQAGLAFTRDVYDRERFERLLAVAGELLEGTAPGGGFAWPAEKGYPTPKVDVRGAVFEEGRVLLVKEAATGLWTLPGGWAEVNLTSAENVEKECREESGLEVRARCLVSAEEMERAGYPPHVHSIYKLTFVCERVGGEPRTGVESLEVGFFPLAGLPPLDGTRTSRGDIERAWGMRGGGAAAFN